MSLAENQRRILLEFLRALRPHWRADRALPARVQRLLADRRCGSRDRRLYRELLYTAIRALPWIESAAEDLAVARIAQLAADIPATSAFRATFADPSAVADLDPTELLPGWLRDECPAAFAPAERDTLLRRAPLWLRLQTDSADSVFAEFAALGCPLVPSGVVTDAWRCPTEIDATQTAAFRSGAFEVQDLGSQLLLATVDGLGPGQNWFDACAGAGGKSLQLARLLGPTGRVDASDIRPAALAELRARADRAGLRNIRTTRSAALGETRYDGVLVDAPCTGSGTWRRAPHLKWITTPTDIARAADLQTRASASPRAASPPRGPPRLRHLLALSH